MDAPNGQEDRMGYYYNGEYLSASEMASELGFVRHNGTWIDPDDYCCECECELSDCSCDVESEKVYKVVTARKDRTRLVDYKYNPETNRFTEVRETYIRKGDKVRVISWFTYQRKGPRTGYNHDYRLVAKGPNWPATEGQAA